MPASFKMPVYDRNIPAVLLGFWPYLTAGVWLKHYNAAINPRAF
jgi:hypothetical protein